MSGTRVGGAGTGTPPPRGPAAPGAGGPDVAAADPASKSRDCSRAHLARGLLG